MTDVPYGTETPWASLGAQAERALAGQGAVVEAMRRVTAALDRSEGSANKLSTKMLALTVLMIVMASFKLSRPGSIFGS